MERNRDDDEDDELLEEKEEDEVPRGWRPSQDIIEAIHGESEADTSKSAVDASTEPQDVSSASLTWAEHKAILNKFTTGETLTAAEFESLKLPISDLQTGTLAEDESWIASLMESERYMEAMQDSREAGDLQEAILAVLKAKGYWKSKS